jgi:hypothetical protein
MLASIHLLATFVADLFKSRRRLEVENLFPRHQLNVALNAPLRDLSKDQEQLLPLQFCPDCITATRG